MTAEREQALKLAEEDDQTGFWCDSRERNYQLLRREFRTSEAEKVEFQKTLINLREVLTHDGEHTRMVKYIDEALAGTPPQPCTTCAELRDEHAQIVDNLCSALMPDAPIENARGEFVLDAMGACQIIRRMREACESKQREIDRLQKVIASLPHFPGCEDSGHDCPTCDRQCEALSGSPANPLTTCGTCMGSRQVYAGYDVDRAEYATKPCPDCTLPDTKETTS